jgi:hypothetical protein
MLGTSLPLLYPTYGKTPLLNVKNAAGSEISDWLTTAAYASREFKHYGKLWRDILFEGKSCYDF